MVDKIQTKVIDADSAPVKGSISNSDYVMIQNDSTKELEKVLVSDLLAGSAGSIRIKGEAQMDNVSTTPTSIVVTGDPDDPTINQGMAPTDPSPNGAAYVVVTNNPNGVSTQITGETRTVFDSDQIVWTGSSWGIVEIGTRVQSVNGRVGNVTGLAEANNVYSKSEADTKFYSDTNKPTPAELGAVNKAGDTMTAPLLIDSDSVNTTPNRGVAKFDGYGVIGNRGSVYITNAGQGVDDKVVIGTGGIHDAATSSVTILPDKVVSSTPLYEGSVRVYSPSNKPTASDVGAVPSGDVGIRVMYAESSNTLDLNQYPQLTGVVRLGNNNPNMQEGTNYGNLVSFLSPPADTAFQLLTGYGINSEVLYFKSGNRTTWESRPWRKIYHTGFKPTPTEIGALGATATAVNSEKLEGSTKAQVIADARTGLELAGTAYSKGESDARYKPIGYVPAWSGITGIPEFATRWPTKAEVGLSNVNNWGASSATNSTSTTTYATTAGVKAAYDAATDARSAPDLAADRKRKITVSSSAPSGGADGDIWLQYV
ncbi:putative phage tail fiber protein [Vibrio phage ICP2]|uniref:Putative phage tail fiber protein n=1 Tax=Vibrio phage ICP2 TaxID=979533 RepID=F1D0V5_9CAUD|nr:tail fiber protein [Vibrio phage ICP2]ADX87706.1 putative phage tail fiber protein [Vibrio phage ICP2]